MKHAKTSMLYQATYKQSSKITFMVYMQEQIALLYAANRLGTARNYERTLRSFSRFMKGKDIPFVKVTESLIEQYNTYLLQRGIVPNSISFYMRILRAVYNKAVRRRLVADMRPFQYVYTGIAKTCKRAIPELIMVQLSQLQLSNEPKLALTRDLFLFSYCMRGMAFVDMAYLQTSNIQGDAIFYTRRKTGQLLSIHIEKTAWRIINDYRSENRKYIFPIIESEDPRQAYREYQLALNNYNRHLKHLVAMLPSPCKLTSYTARHSWATVARKHNIPISVISAGLGHTSEQTTQIYLAALENSVIDDANKIIVAELEVMVSK